MTPVTDFFNFKFLQKIDKYLLINHPFIWCFKFPYILFYGFLLSVLFGIPLALYTVELHEVIQFYKYIDMIKSLLIFPLFFWIIVQNYYIPENEYSKKRLSGLQELFLGLSAILLMEFCLMMIGDINFLKKYTYNTNHQEQLLIDTNNSKRTLAISNISELKKSSYQNEYNKIIIDLSRAKTSKEINNTHIQEARKNYSYFYEINAYSSLISELNMIFFIAIFIVFLRIIEMKKFLLFILGFSIINNVIFQMVPKDSLTLQIIFYILIIILFYIFTKNKLLVLITLILIFYNLSLQVINNLIERSHTLQRDIFYMSIFIFLILISISYFKNFLYKIKSKPKDF